jgi:biopolymer transport protein ExbB
LRILGLIGVAVVAVMLMSSLGAYAQGDGEPAEGASKLFDHFVVDGGVITLFVLIPLSIATIALIVEHSISIRQSRVVPADLLHRVRTALDARRYDEVVRATGEDESVLAATIRSGLSQAGNGGEAMQRAMYDTVEQAAGRLMRKIEYLNVIGNVSPMIGLFGTVVGMIRLFASISDAGGIPEPAKIAADISIALVTTFWGLLVAIPALTVYAFFRNRIDSLATECATSSELLLANLEAASTGASATRPPVAPAPRTRVARRTENLYAFTAL